MIRRYNDIEIVENIHSKDNYKKVKIDSRRNNNYNCKINRSYKIDILNNNVVLANLITRKGKKYDISENINEQEESIRLLDFNTYNINYDGVINPIDYVSLAGNEVLKNITDMRDDLQIIPELNYKINDYVNQIKSHENMNIRKLQK